MAAKTSLALLDSALTPEAPGTPGAATRTFVPGEIENGNVHTFYENTTGSTAASRSQIKASLIPGPAVTRLRINLALPKATTVDGILQVQHITRGSVEFIFPNDCSRDDRRDTKVLLVSCLDESTISKMYSDLENLW